jgi:hypothetical protein
VAAGRAINSRNALAEWSHVCTASRGHEKSYSDQNPFDNVVPARGGGTFMVPMLALKSFK